MALPININELITGKTVEWERIEFKKGWNPLEFLHSVSAFANDINNWGGGYIIIGTEEKDGKPILPPLGIQANQVDKMQKELLNLCYKIVPNYFPVVEPIEFQGKLILIIWVPGGPVRPYKAPESLAKGSLLTYFIRRYSVTKKASEAEVRDLLQMSAQIPYDDQIRQTASLNDLNLQFIQEFLTEVGSDLATKTDLPFRELCRRMNIAEGPDEFLKPKNIGLLMFNDSPEKFFSCAQIDLVEFKNDVGDRYTEKIFTGPIHHQLRSALIYIKNNLIAEKVEKVPGIAESRRFYNYPFEAIEEALVNTVYHRSYQDDSPIEVRAFPNMIELISYPGPLPPLNKEKLRSGKISARKYRNRRIGDFLKELHLTEGRGTGIMKIKRVMEQNGSPEPTFDTDDELSYFLTVLPIHPEWQSYSDGKNKVGARDRDRDGDRDGDRDPADREMIILDYCLRPKKRREIMIRLNLYNNPKNFSKYVQPILDKGYLELTLPDKLSSKNQQYKTTHTGEAYLKGND